MLEKFEENLEENASNEARTFQTRCAAELYGGCHYQREEVKANFEES